MLSDAHHKGVMWFGADIEVSSDEFATHWRRYSIEDFSAALDCVLEFTLAESEEPHEVELPFSLGGIFLDRLDSACGEAPDFTLRQTDGSAMSPNKAVAVLILLQCERLAAALTADLTEETACIALDLGELIAELRLFEAAWHHRTEASAVAVASNAAKAAHSRHTEHRQLREMAIAYYRANKARFKSKEEAATEIAKEVVPVERSTVRRWLQRL